MLGCRAIDDNEGLRVEHLFAGFNTRLGPLLAVGGLYLAGSFGIMIVAGILVAVVGGVGILYFVLPVAPSATWAAAPTRTP